MRGPTPQAFRAGDTAWGVQFHPEVRHDQLLAWFRDDPTLDRPLSELEAELDEKLGAWQDLGRKLCRAFLAAARREQVTVCYKPGFRLAGAASGAKPSL